MSESTPPLSERGVERREEILSRALAEAGRRRRRRAAGRAGVALAVVGGLAAVTAVVWPLREGKSPEVIVRRATPETLPAVAPAEPRVIVTRIATDPGIVERLAIHAEPVRVQRIRDEELLRELAAADQPAGLAYVNGKAVLMFR